MMRLNVLGVLAVSLAVASCTDAPTAIRPMPADSPRTGAVIGSPFWSVEKYFVTVNGFTADASVPVVIPAGESRSLGFSINVVKGFSNSPSAVLKELALTACDSLPVGFTCTVDAPVGDPLNGLALRDYPFPALTGDASLTVTINVGNPSVCGTMTGTVINKVSLTSDDGVEAFAEARVDVQVAACVTPPVAGNLGCSPGYWKNHNFPATYNKAQLFFGTASNGSAFANAFPGMSLQQVLAKGGGGLTALGRQTVGAYFNAVSLANFRYTPKQIIDKFNAAAAAGASASTTLQNEFEALTDVNGRSCPNPTGK